MTYKPTFDVRPLTILIFLLSSFVTGCEPASATRHPQPDSDQKAFPSTMTTPPSTRSTQYATDWWHPTVGLTWQWQIGDLDIDTSIEADVYDIDLYVDQSILDDLHAQGRKVICYMSIGSYEDWRPDKDQFPAEVLGNDYDGWKGEKWLDIRRIDLLAPIMLARLDLCKAKGFDAVEPDNMEIYTNNTGFPLTYDDQLKYALWFADEAHKRGLAIGQKNASDQVKDLLNIYDFAITEDYFYYDQVESMLPYIKAGKPVFAAEYTDLPGEFAAFCEQSKKLNFSTILKHRGLDVWVKYCP